MVFGILLVGSSSVSATPITFDFEGSALGGSGSFSTVISTQSGLTLTVTRQDGANIGIQNLNFFPTVPDFGNPNHEQLSWVERNVVGKPRLS